MNDFDPSRFNRRTSTPSKPQSERLFVARERYETPPDGFHFVVGRLVNDPEVQVRVRLNTVKERVEDRPRDDPEKIKSQYVSGENHRDSVADKAKADIPLLSFDDARKVGTHDGVVEYRAHWPKTMSTNPEAEALFGMAHIRLRDASDLGDGVRTNAQAYVELFKETAVASRDNIDAALSRALRIQDEQGRARDPLVILRVRHDGKQVAAPRIYPGTEKKSVFDQGLGDYKEVSRRVDAGTTLERVMSAAPGRNDFETRQLDTARALIAGIKGLGEPEFASPDPNIRGDLRNLYYGAEQGALDVEIVAAEKIDFGADSRKTYLADKDRAHLAAYEIREESEADQQPRRYAGYAETVLAVHRYPDGEPYAVFASPAEMYPRMTKLADLPMEVAPQMELDGEHLAVSAEQSAFSAGLSPEQEERSEADNEEMVPS
ncbi:MAG: hypothetical protein JWL65_2847 [Gammaproteobacteria bacterium]|nr:hypothetical protein [Gammaproteobacteria bacterium]